MEDHDLGIIGLGVMGQNLALNVADHGYSVAGYDRDAKKIAQAIENTKGHNVELFAEVGKFVNSLKRSRKVLMMVPAGKAVDDVIQDLRPQLSEGDVLIDGGNSHFRDTIRRGAELQAAGLLYIGTGISGGEEGARRGPAIMPGGDKNAWHLMRDIFQSIAAKADDGMPCCDWIGPEGAGHFVKMVHNGIEYGDMQMICEAYLLMDRVLKIPPEEMGEIFKEWNRGELNSYLIGITSDILRKSDPETDLPMVEIILDTAGQKGTGKWTSQVALDFGVPAPTIAEAVFARTLSAIKEERVKASRIFKANEIHFTGNKERFIEDIRKALYASKICSYAQGFDLMRSAKNELGWELDLGGIASIWRAGCIIRAQFLNRISEAYSENPNLSNLLLWKYFKDALENSQESWRKTILTAVDSGVPVPAFSSALAYYDGYRSERLPANLLQAQRDYFGAHTYERVDKPRGQFYHTSWTLP